jgi:DinB superfamily
VGVQQLEEFHHQIQKIQQQAADLTQGLTEPQFNWRPAPDEWSVEECLAHLTMVGQWEVVAIEQAIDDARSRGLTGSGPFHYGTIERFIVDASGVGPDGRARRPFPAPRRFIPVHNQPITAIVPTFQHLQLQLLIQLDRAEGLHLSRVKVKTPISRFLKLSLGSMFAQIVAHEQRHMAQARRVRDKI